MSHYKIAKLVGMAGEIDSRKRLQKMVHLLQAVGCDFGFNFRIHHYGPYSSQLATQLDSLTHAGVLEESEECDGGYKRYGYRLSSNAAERLAAYEASESGESEHREIEAHKEFVESLMATPPRELELAATIVAMCQAGRSREDSFRETATFKNEPLDSHTILAARGTADRILNSANGETE